MSRPLWDPERLEDHFSRGAGARSSYHVSVRPGVRPGGQWNPDLSGGPELEHAASVLWEEWVKHSWVSLLIRVWESFTFSRFKCHPSQLCLLFWFPSLVMYCTDPGHVEHSTRTLSDPKLLVGTTIQYSCIPGHVLQGGATLTCYGREPGTPVWTSRLPRCVCEFPQILGPVFLYLMF